MFQRTVMARWKCNEYLILRYIEKKVGLNRYAVQHIDLREYICREVFCLGKDIC